ncbi:MAG TPA: hypothetical protein VMS17_16020 [Gemmataceae bacterium]|nr:hypothetical protein [Gemmataceae bacterium]
MAEVTQCPQCQRKLNVQEAQLGQTVQCPVCGTFFTAAALGVQRGPTAAPQQPPPPPRYDEPPPPRPRYDEPPRPRYDDDYDRGRGYYPPRRGYGGYYRDPYADPLPHRGGAVLALGLVAMLLSCIPLAGWIMGGIALSMANTDIPRMDRGYMDREGRGQTVAGQVCAIIAVIISSICAMIACAGINGAFR